jgi:glyoxylase-like metal-dependent hydrolase (beta-lactamase superfamily II)
VNLAYETLVVGPMSNNVYFLVDQESKECVIVDPSFLPQTQLNYIEEKGWMLRQIWITHGHFDHIAGVKAISEAFDPPVPIVMSLESFGWAKANPPTGMYGIRMDEVPRVDIPLKHGMWLGINPESDEKVVEVRDVSGHNPGSVIFYCTQLKIAIVGDAIFKDSIGRTDLAGSDHEQLLKNIREQIYTLPEDTILLPGHMDATTVGHEKRFNPFVRA